MTFFLSPLKQIYGYSWSLLKSWTEDSCSTMAGRVFVELIGNYYHFRIWKSHLKLNSSGQPHRSSSHHSDLYPLRLHPAVPIKWNGGKLSGDKRGAIKKNDTHATKWLPVLCSSLLSQTFPPLTFFVQLPLKFTISVLFANCARLKDRWRQTHAAVKNYPCFCNLD